MPFLPTVLVVDDEIRSQKALRRTLEEDFGVFTASSLAEARTVMEREDAQIVLTDQRMLEVSGVAFLKGVRETWPDTVRIIISGYTQTNQMDVIRAILMLLRQVNEGRAEVENGFIRAITPSGNRKAQALMDQVFEVRDRFEWRGLGEIPLSALRLRAAYAAFDAEHHYTLGYRSVADNRACECAVILRGLRRPIDCKLFGTVCTPEAPMGSCMVSSEGACTAHYTYGRHKDAQASMA
ncbi:response regulator [Metallibacterium sp.]|uniref:response regulator n=1 Tax=Metallibacterium sp. TaxID=2940281 RepID=UPI0026313D9F|nr:response regulator [Metallibacterium sp.]